MSKMTESDREDFEPARAHMAPQWARRFFGFFGVDTYTGDVDED